MGVGVAQGLCECGGAGDYTTSWHGGVAQVDI